MNEIWGIEERELNKHSRISKGAVEIFKAHREPDEDYSAERYRYLFSLAKNHHEDVLMVDLEFKKEGISAQRAILGEWLIDNYSLV